MFGQKIKAGGIHFLLSLVIISAYLAVVFLLWYPDPYASLEKVIDAAKIVVGVDLVLGPLLTFLLYKKGKKGLKMDLSLVVMMQVLALTWGIHVTYKQRPVYIAFAEQMFSVVAASDLEGKQPTDKSLQANGWGDQKLVFIELPNSSKEKLALFLKQSNIYAMVDRYQSYKDHLDVIFESAIDVEKRIESFPELKNSIDTLIKQHGGDLKDYGFISVEGRKALAFVVLRRADGAMVDIILDP